MAAPKNSKERERILKKAIELFMQKGYRNTSIQDIADACDIGKSKIQYYYPKKELFISIFLERHLETVSKKYVGNQDGIEQIIKGLYTVGYFHFDYLLNNKKMTLLTKDIVASRELTESVVHMEAEWAARYLTTSNQNDIADSITVAMGGAYELIYKYQSEGKNPSPRYIEDKCLLPFLISIGVDQQLAITSIRECGDEIELKNKN